MFGILGLKIGLIFAESGRLYLGVYSILAKGFIGCPLMTFSKAEYYDELFFTKVPELILRLVTRLTYCGG
jgi:hypothetical protein